jgi:hypothetical protein
MQRQQQKPERQENPERQEPTESKNESTRRRTGITRKLYPQRFTQLCFLPLAVPSGEHYYVAERGQVCFRDCSGTNTGPQGQVR